MPARVALEEVAFGITAVSLEVVPAWLLKLVVEAPVFSVNVNPREALHLAGGHARLRVHGVGEELAEVALVGPARGQVHGALSLELLAAKVELEVSLGEAKRAVTSVPYADLVVNSAIEDHHALHPRCPLLLEGIGCGGGDQKLEGTDLFSPGVRLPDVNRLFRLRRRRFARDVRCKEPVSADGTVG